MFFRKNKQKGGSYVQENVKRSLINISVLIPLHIFQILLNFASRTVFVKTLGSEYLGINVIFGDISTLLSLTELGLNGAIMYALYGPIKERDKTKISQIINYAKGVFNKIALAIMIIGIILMSFLKYVINTDINFLMVLWFYFLNLVTVAVTYLATYKSTLISTDEKNYIVKTYYTAANALKVILQIAVLFLFQNYTMYLI